MGPLITRSHRDRVAGYLETAEAEGAEVVLDGREINVPGCDDGFFLGPSLVDRVTADDAGLPGRDLRTGPVGAAGRRPGRGHRGGQRQSLRQRDGHLHP